MKDRVAQTSGWDEAWQQQSLAPMAHLAHPPSATVPNDSWLLLSHLFVDCPP